MKTRYVLLIAAIVVLLDQLSKYLVKTYLTLGQPITVIKHVLYFKYVQNSGASFSILQGWTWFLIAFAIFVLILIFYMYEKIEKTHKPFIGLIVGGTIGNLIDRISYGYVIDFIDFRIWPNFNIADSAVCIGALLLIYFIWRYPEKK